MIALQIIINTTRKSNRKKSTKSFLKIKKELILII